MIDLPKIIENLFTDNLPLLVLRLILLAGALYLMWWMARNAKKLAKKETERRRLQDQEQGAADNHTIDRQDEEAEDEIERIRRQQQGRDGLD